MGDELIVRHLVVDLHLQFTTNENVERGNVNGEEDLLGHVCQRNHRSVSLFEMALLTDASYVHDRQAVWTFVEGLNDALGTDWSLVYPGMDDPGPSRLPRSSWKSIVELHSRSRNTTVIVVRGTDLTSLFDMLQDVSIYVESFLYQLMAHVIPAAHLVPAALVSDAIELAGALEAYTVPWIRRRGDDASYYFHDVLVKHIIAGEDVGRFDRDSLFLVGHSLGGAVAHIAGAQRGIKSFGIQSPGIVLPRKKFGLHKSTLHRYATTVFVSDDIVPHIGWQAGELLQFECTEAFRERCHAAEPLATAIWRSCASVRRNFPRIDDVWVV